MRRLASLMLAIVSSAFAAPHRVRVFPNPSIRVFSIAEGPDRMLWLAAADGLYRFDGFHYDKITAYPFLSADFVGFTRDGALWCAGFEGLARATNGRFDIVLREQMSAMAVYPDQVFVRLTDGLARVAIDGSVTRLTHRFRRDLTIDASGKLWGVCMDPKRACWVDPARPSELHSIELPRGIEYQQAIAARDAMVWAADGDRARLIENGHEISSLARLPSHEQQRPGPFVVGRNGQLWFLGEVTRGLSPPVEFADRADDDRYPPSAGLEDSRGHFWKFSMGQGLSEWTADPEWQRWFPENFSGEPVVQVIRDHNGAEVVATFKNLYRRNAAGEWKALMKDEHRFDAILALDDGGFLASIRNLGVVRISAEGQIVEHIANIRPPVDQYREQYRQITRDGKGRIWVGTKRVLLRVEGSSGSLHFREVNLPGEKTGRDQDPVDLELDASGRLWAGSMYGLAWLDDDDRWHAIETDRPVTMVRSFTYAGGDIWVTHRRAGQFSRLHPQGDRWTVEQFRASDGYTPVDSYFIKRDSRGWLWRGSPDGVFVSDGVHVAPNDWLHLNMSNGLASNETSLYGFYEDAQSHVWISGDEGLTRLHPDSSWFGVAAQSAPQITRIDADGRVYLFPAPIPTQLPSGAKDVKIEIGTLQAPATRQAPLRYRVRPLSEDWTFSRDGVIELHDLKSRAYTLELGYAGDGPSPVATYRLQIGTPISWGWPLGVFAITALLIPAVRYAPMFERLRFRLSKRVFLLRRRWAKGSSTLDGAPATNDYSGETMANRYRLLRILSRGGFSIVYEALDVKDGDTRVAVKVLNRSSAGESQVRDRFAHEVAALRSIDHPGVVRILDSWINHAGEPCLAMPLLNGSTLRAALRETPLERDRAAATVSQTGAALSEVHRLGIVHRDLKPENIMLIRVSGVEQAVIIDFGTAGLRSAVDELAATTLMAGSFFYMAPERLTGRYSPASDVYSLGVIALEMLTAKRLSDLSAIFSEPEFVNDLEKALRVSLPKDSAAAVAEQLAPAFDPEPHKRPLDVKSWADDLAEKIRRQ